MTVTTHRNGDRIERMFRLGRRWAKVSEVRGAYVTALGTNNSIRAEHLRTAAKLDRAEDFAFDWIQA